MKIAVIGAGNVGSTLGAALAAKGHEIYFAVRDPGAQKYRELAENIGDRARPSAIGEAVEEAEVVILATPWRATQEAVREAGDLEGKIVIDCTNPLRSDLSGLEVGGDASGAEMVARWARGAKVYKAFNQTGFNIMADPVVERKRSVMLVCGDDEAAKPKVMRLVEDVGFEAIDFGRLEGARLLEPLALIWIRLAHACGLGRDIAFGLLRR